MLRPCVSVRARDIACDHNLPEPGPIEARLSDVDAPPLIWSKHGRGLRRRSGRRAWQQAELSGDRFAELAVLHIRTVADPSESERYNAVTDVGAAGREEAHDEPLRFSHRQVEARDSNGELVGSDVRDLATLVVLTDC